MKNYYGIGILHYRLVSRVKQAELAEYLNMSRQNLSEIENGRRKLSRKKMVIAANKLGITPEDIEAQSGIPKSDENQNQTEIINEHEHSAVEVPSSLISGLQKTLKNVQQALSDSQSLNAVLLLEIKKMKEYNDHLSPQGNLSQ